MRKVAWVFFVFFSMVSQSLAEETVEDLPDVAAAIHSYRVTNETAKSVYTRVLQSEFEKACNVGNLDAAKAIEEEMANVSATEHELTACVVSSKKIAVARKAFEKSFGENHAAFAKKLETIIVDYTKKQDLETAAKVKEYAMRNPYSADAAPWIYLFDGTEESYRKNWCQHPEFKVENGMLCGPYAKIDASKTIFEKFVLEAEFVLSGRVASVIYRCQTTTAEIGTSINLLDGKLFVRTNNLMDSHECKIAPLKPGMTCRFGIRSDSKATIFIFNGEPVYLLPGPPVPGRIAIEGGSFTKIRIRKLR